MKKNTTGFTIVELLIVIVVIAILAAISTVAYNGIQNRTHDSAVQQDLRNFANILHLYNAEHGTYPLGIASPGAIEQLAQYGAVKVTANAYDQTGIHTTGRYNYLYCRSMAEPVRFALIAKSRSGATFQFRDGGVSRYTGGEPAGADVLCGRMGITDTSSYTRLWLYSGGAFRFGVGS